MSHFSSSNGTLTLTKTSLLMRPMWFTTVSAIRLTSLQYTTMMIPPSLSSLSSLLTTAISSSNLRIPRFDFTQKEPPEENFLGGFLIPHPPAVCRRSAPCRRPPLFPITPQSQAAVRRSDALAPYPPSACKSAQKSRPKNRAACILEKLLELYALTNRIGYGKLYALCGVAGARHLRHIAAALEAERRRAVRAGGDARPCDLQRF